MIANHLLNNRWISKPWVLSIGLLLLCSLSFGPLILTLGLYWDDWPSLWFLHFFGSASFPQAFAADRPVQGWLFVLTTSLVGESILAWHIFGIIARWLSVMALGWMLNSLWPERKTQVFWITILFLLYPGFTQQYLPITTGHQFLIMSFVFFSMGLMIWSIRKPGCYRTLTFASLLVSVLCMFALEYYFGLELLRPVFLWLIACGQAISIHKRFFLTFKRWMPYAIADMFFLIWRLTHATPRGEVVIFRNLSANPSATLIELLKTIANDIYESTAVAWGRIFTYLNFSGMKLSMILGYLGIAVFVALFVFLLLNLSRASLLNQSAQEGGIRQPNWGFQAILIGLFTLLVAGWPVWVTELRLEMSMPWDRFTLPMMLGSCLVFVGLLDLLIRPDLPKLVIISLVAGLAAGAQFHYAFDYRVDWAAQKDFFWQFAWRAPALKPGTLLLTSDLPFFSSSDNSLTASFNWIYAPQLDSLQMPYLLYDLNARLGNRLPDLAPNIPISQEYRATVFKGSTSQALVFYYKPPRCLKILDFNADRLYPNKPDVIVQALPLSRLELIEPGAPSLPIMPDFLGPEPDHNWCYYFEKLELANQFKEWDEAARLADQALDFRPEHTRETAAELIPLVISYAQAGQYDKAVKLSLYAGKLSDKMPYSICDAWYSMKQQTENNQGFQAGLDKVNQEFNCKMP